MHAPIPWLQRMVPDDAPARLLELVPVAVVPYEEEGAALRVPLPAPLPLAEPLPDALQAATPTHSASNANIRMF
jgi:hypothetical protein